MNDRIVIDFEEHIARVTLNRPAKHNALDPALFAALNDIPAALAKLDDLRAVVVSGAGPSFCSGLDLASFMADADALETIFDAVPGRPANTVQHAALCWRFVEAPVIAAIHGRCFGGGLQIALGTDLRIAARGAEFSVMEIKWGLVPDMGITQSLLRLVPPDVAKELTFTACVLSAREANDLGLVTRLADDPLAAALDLARDIAARSPDAVRAAKRLFDAAPDADFADGLAQEAAAQRALIGRPNQLEAVNANFARRPPRFAPAAKS